MKNKNIKELYIKEANTNNINAEVSIRRIFERIKEWEDKLDKDCSMFTINEIIDFYKSYCTSSYHFLNVTNSFLKMYTSFCQLNNLLEDGQNHYEEVTSDLLINCTNFALVQSKIISRDEFVNLFKNVPNVQDQFMIFAVFNGICGREMIDLRTISLSQFTTKEKKVFVTLTSGKSFEVDPLLFDLAEESAQTYEYYCGEDYENIRQLCKTDLDIIKRGNNSKQESNIILASTIMSRFRRVKLYTECNAVNPGALLESGRINLINKYIREEKVDFFTAAQSHVKEISIRYGKIQNYTAYEKKYHEFLEG